MTYQQLIDKWEGQLSLWRDTAKDNLFRTKEDREKGSLLRILYRRFLD